jgi:hypothetical protein
LDSNSLYGWIKGGHLCNFGLRGGYVFFLMDSPDPYLPVDGHLICSTPFTACHAKLVFMTKVMAITALANQYHSLIAQEILNPLHRIHIHVDRQAALKALKSTIITSQVVLDWGNPGTPLVPV